MGREGKIDFKKETIEETKGGTKEEKGEWKGEMKEVITVLNK